MNLPRTEQELARQKLLWQAEALDQLRNGVLRNCSAFVVMTLEAEARKLRRQAEEAP